MTFIQIAIVVVTAFSIAVLVLDFRAQNRLARAQQKNWPQKRKQRVLFEAQLELAKFYHENRWTMDRDEFEAQLRQRRNVIKIYKVI